jgi:hypothetical protein
MRVRVALVALALLATGCKQQPAIERVKDDLYTPPSTSATPSATPSARYRSGPAAPGCTHGWGEPEADSPLRKIPLDLLRAAAGIKDSFRVVDLRYFIGPDDANLAPDSKQDGPVERWYGKVVSTKDTAFKVRFIAVRRKVGSGIAAVAPYGTSGFESPDWHGFEGEGRSTVKGVPGTWAGSAFDYVKAKELPPQVVGCVGS